MPATLATADREQPGPSEAVLRSMVEFALRAPSVHNTQPWHWHLGAGRLDLFADGKRRLPVADPRGRNLGLSCGAALEYAVVAAAALGWSTRVVLQPSAEDPDHLATLRFVPQEPDRRALADADLLRARTTDRRRFIPWPIPDDLLETLGRRAAVGRATALPVLNVADRVSVELLLSRATSVERTDRALMEEQRRWLGENPAEGIPTVNARPPAEDLPPLAVSRFDLTGGSDDGALLAPTDGLLVLVTGGDETSDWLDAGRMLVRLWAAAMDRGLSLVPLSQLIEVADTRATLRSGVLDVEEHPQLLVRLGWQELSRSSLPPTPRRALDDVLVD